MTAKKVAEKRIGRPIELEGFWPDLIKKAGGERPLAVEIGKGVRQLRRIAKGECACVGSTLIVLQSVVKKYGFEVEFNKWWHARNRAWRR